MSKIKVTSDNHESNTQVELFLDKELSDITFDNDSLDEWKAVCADLGMEEQISLTKGKKSPIPYPYMNESMKRVYSMLCPESVSYKVYNKTPIPLEVLKQISFSIKENHFTEIEIWYDDKTPDPLVIGRTCMFYTYTDGCYSTHSGEFKTREEAESVKHKDAGIHTTDGDRYLVAKWGDVKRSFNELKTIAKDRFIEKHASQMKLDIEKLSGKLKTIEDNATLYLMGEISESKATTTNDW